MDTDAALPAASVFLYRKSGIPKKTIPAVLLKKNYKKRLRAFLIL